MQCRGMYTFFEGPLGVHLKQEVKEKIWKDESLLSVIGEKSTDNCSELFCYMDSIGEAYRVYGGVAWLRYNKQFWQHKALWPLLRWDHKDISLWMCLMASLLGG